MYLGTDPEFIVVNEHGKPIPAHRAGFPSSEEKRMFVPATLPINPTTGQPYSPEADVWQVRAFRDGFAVEVNTRAFGCRQAMTTAVREGIKAINAFLKPQGYHLASIPAVKVDLEDILSDAPPDVMQFGCKPSLCAYTGQAKVPPIDAVSHPYRYAGGHLHFGYCAQGLRVDPTAWMLNFDNHPAAVKLLDLYVGLPLTCMFHGEETYLRRRFYGQAGEYRSQVYGGELNSKKNNVGVEYRTPGPEVWNAPWVASFALGVGRCVLQNFAALARGWDKKLEDHLRCAIDTGEGREKLLAYVAKATPLGAVGLGWTNLDGFNHMIAHAPRRLMLHQAGDETIRRGFREWATEPERKLVIL